MSWYEAILPVFFALIVMLVPGVPIAFAVRARGIAFFAVSIASSVSAIAASAVVAPLLHLSWQAYTPFLVSLPVAVIGWVLRRFWLRRLSAARGSEWGRHLLAAGLAVVIGAVLIAIPLISGIGSPNHIAQTPDVTFHLNAVRQILDTGNASTLALNLASPKASVLFYPDAWHAIVALVTQLSGASIVVATNATAIVVACVVWSIACVFLARQLFGRRALPLILTGVLSAAFATFPLMMVEYGVLYPFLLGVALMPILLGLVVLALGRAKDAEFESPARWLLLAWAAVGATIAHPSAIFGIVALSFPLAVQLLVEHLLALRGRPHGCRRGWATIALFVVGCLAVAAVWVKSSAGPGSNPTEPYQSIGQALGEALLNSATERPIALVVSLLMILGIVVVARYRRADWWIVGSWAVSVLLFMTVTGYHSGRLRSLLVGSWYNNSPRLAALLPLMALPLAVIGAVALIRWLQRRLRNARRLNDVDARRVARASTALGVVCVLLLIPLTQANSSIGEARNVVSTVYEFNKSSPLLSPDEVAMFDVVKKKTPANAVIGGNPWNGSALVYAYTGRTALFPHIRGSWTDAQLRLAAGFASATPAICADVAKLGVDYVLDFGDRYLTPDNPRTTEYPGFDNLSKSRALSLVAQRGDAKLYKVTSCRVG